MKKLLIVLILLFYSCESEKIENFVKPNFHFSSYNLVVPDGNNFFSKSLTKSLLAKSISQFNISDTTEWIDEGTVKIIATQIYKNTDSALTLYWDSEDKLKSILLNKSNSKWSVNKLKVGMSIDEVVKTNSTDFSFYGFGWDNGGFIYNWNNGILADSLANIGVFLNVDWEKVGNKNIDKYMGDSVRLNSQNKELKKLGITISSIIVKY